jgi:hypothetical protein
MIEEDDSIKLSYYGFSAILTLVPIQELYPHEEINDLHLEELIALLKKDPYLNEPLVVDLKTNVVLDGMHRLEALKRLGMFHAPCMLVEYFDEKIKVEKWIREASYLQEITFGNIMNEILNLIKDEKILIHKLNNKFYEKSMLNILKENFFLIFDNIILYLEDIDLEKSNILIKQFDRIFNVNRYITFQEFEDVKLSHSLAYYSGKLVSKSEVVEFARKGKLLPAKTTKHNLPFRIKNIRTPLIILLEKDPFKAKRKFIEWLNKRQMDIKIA